MKEREELTKNEGREGEGRERKNKVPFKQRRTHSKSVLWGMEYPEKYVLGVMFIFSAIINDKCRNYITYLNPLSFRSLKSQAKLRGHHPILKVQACLKFPRAFKSEGT